MRERTSIVAATLFLTALLGACAGKDPPAASAASSSVDPNAPCGPNDCTPCDETKQKCMGPMVCDNHPELASRQCKRDTDGTCKDMIVCADAGAP